VNAAWFGAASAGASACDASVAELHGEASLSSSSAADDSLLLLLNAAGALLD